MPTNTSSAPVANGGYHRNRIATDTTYADFAFWHFTRAGLRTHDAGQALHLGLELEVDGFDYGPGIDHAREYLTDNYASHGYCKHTSDGSLNHGFEIVTAPMTLSAHRAVNWKPLLDNIASHGGKSHDTRTCGIHVHVSRSALGADAEAKTLCIAKLLELVERFQAECSCLARRNIATCQWCSPTGYGHSLTDGSRAMRRKATRIQNEQGFGVHNGERYHAINLQNTNTIEFRIFKGSLEADTVYATLAFVDGIVRYCKQHTTPEVHNATFGDIIDWIADDTLTAYWATRRGQVSRYTAYVGRLEEHCRNTSAA